MSISKGHENQKKNKVRDYKYGGATYTLFYEQSSGKSELVRQDWSGFIPTGTTVVFDNGGWNEDGTNDSNLVAAGLDVVHDQIIVDINAAYKISGGNANGGILPEYVENKIGLIEENAKKKEGDNEGSTNIEPWIGFDAELFANDFGGTDNILQQLSLRNLKYPIDADYGNTQDYIQINQFTYKAPNRDVIFGSEEGPGFAQQVTKGLPTTSKIEKPIGLVKLPMPNDLKDTNNVSWDQDQMNTLTAAMAGAVMRGIPQAAGTIGKAFGGQFGEVFKDMQKAGSAMFQTGQDIWTEVNQKGSQAQAMAHTMIGSSVLNMLGFSASAESILARGFGVIPNDNMELLFRSPTLREFTFSWIISPRSKEEAKKVNNIIRFFKQGMAVKKKKGTAGGASLFLHTPNVFDIAFKTSKYKNELTNENISVMKIKTCALVSCGVEYTPGTSGWQAYEKGQPVSVTMALRFKELEPIFDTDYSDNYFDFMDREDLDPVSIDAVGY